MEHVPVGTLPPQEEGRIIPATLQEAQDSRMLDLHEEVEDATEKRRRKTSWFSRETLRLLAEKTEAFGSIQIDRYKEIGKSL